MNANENNFILALKNNATSLMVGFIFAITYIVFDLILRVSFSNTVPLQKLTLPEVGEISLAANKLDILPLYQQYKQTKKSVVKKTVAPIAVKAPVIVKKQLGIGKQRENLQNGNLTDLYFGENKIILSGVFFSEQKFAVVTIIKLSEQSKTIKKIIKGQSLFDYQLVEINQKSIKLIRNNQQIKLTLFTK